MFAPDTLLAKCRDHLGHDDYIRVRLQVAKYLASAAYRKVQQEGITPEDAETREFSTIERAMDHCNMLQGYSKIKAIRDAFDANPELSRTIT